MDSLLLSDLLDIPPTPTTPHADDASAVALGAPSSLSSAPEHDPPLFDFDFAAASAAAAQHWPQGQQGSVWGAGDVFGFGQQPQEDDVWQQPEGQLGGGIELGDIAPLPGFPPASSFLPSFHSPAPPIVPQAPSVAPPAPVSRPYDTPSPASSSHLSSLPPPTPPACALGGVGVAPGSLKRSRSEESDATVGAGGVNPYALSLASGSPEPEWSSASSSGAVPPKVAPAVAPAAPAKKELTGKGKKRKQLPTVAEFQPPSTDGLSKKEARLVKNRAAAFLSRQRKREQFDEMEVVVGQLRAEIAALKAGGAAVPAHDAQEVAALKQDLANVRALLHASTARERALEVEVASLRAQLARAAPAVAGAGLPHSAVQGPMVSGIEEFAASGPRRGERRREPERETKRIGGVALMVIMFSFALFSFPSSLSSLPNRLSNTASSNNPFPSFLGRVLQASSAAAPRFANVTIAKDTGLPVCTIKDKKRLKEAGEVRAPGNATAEDDQMACDAPSTPSSSSTGAEHGSHDLAWPLLPPVEGQSDVTRRSLSLTLLRPVPSPADAHQEAVDDVLSRWLEMTLDDVVEGAAAAGESGLVPSAAAAGVAPAAADGAQQQDAGWLLIGPGEDIAHTTGSADLKAWDGSTIERMELDDILAPPTSSSAALAVPSPAAVFPESAIELAPAEDLAPAPYRRASAQFPHLYALAAAASPPTLPLSDPSSASATAAAAAQNATTEPPTAYMRLDLEVGLSLRKKAASVVDREEVGRLLDLSSAPGGPALGGGLLGRKGLGLEGLI